MKVKRIISKIIRHHLLFNFWIFVKRISLYGLNYGVASGLPEYSGENFIIKSILAAFCGIQSNKKFNQDDNFIQKNGISSFILIGFGLVFILGLVLYFIVDFILS